MTGRAMNESGEVIPLEALPDGFVQRLRNPPGEVAEPKPAATVVLARRGMEGMEVLLLKRTRSAGFVPGAYVFPGGGVDPDDAASELLGRCHELDSARAEERLAIPSSRGAGPKPPPAFAYYLAAARETFEETGLLVALDEDGKPAPSLEESPRVRRLRDDLLAGRVGLLQVLQDLELVVDGASMEYIAHWITPELEPRRYDTRFFLARVPGNRSIVPEPREIARFVWLTPGSALKKHRAGELPMVLPTVETLKSLSPFDSPEEALEHFRQRTIPSILPEFVSTPEGVRVRFPR